MWLQDNAETILDEAQAERGFALLPAWRDTLLVLLKVHGVDTPAINCILDTIQAIEREAGRLPPAAPLNLK
jgi:hypothetical protein